ncbi:MAG TPA: ATP-binding protein [Gaiellaceae bacterium]|nr:ATP-binding protein [Gaiellaceae bacterium]
MNPVRRVGTRLSLALAVVVVGALAVVWVALVPTLEHRLVAGRLSELKAAIRPTQRDAAQLGPRLSQDFFDQASREADARVVYFRLLSPTPRPTLSPLFDSAGLSIDDAIERDPLALRAETHPGIQAGRVTRSDEDYAEAALADSSGDVILFSANLHSTLEDVDLVRTRLLWSGLIGLAVALVAGFGAASVFARRIRRLERAADRIAAGDFAEPVEDPGRDELGELAAAFDRMRLRLARLDDARREFIANASHELRTPIFSLGGFLELLRDEDLDEATRAEFLATATEQVERLSKLATDLLDLSRLDAGPMRFEREPLELAGLAADLAEEFGALALRHGRTLEVAVEADGLALGDRERVLQIGRALVDNALLHTPDGTRIRLVVRGAELSVVDDGQGIPAEHQEQVFARFSRLEGSRASGTGLGLAIARELAVRMEGSLELDSRPGRTAFTLRLPVFSRENELAATVR